MEKEKKIRGKWQISAKLITGSFAFFFFFFFAKFSNMVYYFMGPKYFEANASPASWCNVSYVYSNFNLIISNKYFAIFVLFTQIISILKYMININMTCMLLNVFLQPAFGQECRSKKCRGPVSRKRGPKKGNYVKPTRWEPLKCPLCDLPVDECTCPSDSESGSEDERPHLATLCERCRSDNPCPRKRRKKRRSRRNFHIWDK